MMLYSSMAGIKSQKGTYKALTPDLCSRLSLPRAMVSGGYDDYLLFNNYLCSPHYSSDKHVEEILLDDEECFRGKSLFILDSLYVKKEILFMLVHKSPHRVGNRVEGVVFNNLLLPGIGLRELSRYLSNPDILVAEHTKKYIDIQALAPARRLGLSKRELDCLQYLVKGLSAAEIAQLLYVSRRTVEGYLANIKEKLGVNKVSELVAFTVMHDILPNICKLSA